MAFILNLLLGDAHVVLRILLIVLFLIGLTVEVSPSPAYSSSRIAVDGVGGVDVIPNRRWL